jgi:hypothetical protein
MDVQEWTGVALSTLYTTIEMETNDETASLCAQRDYSQVQYWCQPPKDTEYVILWRKALNSYSCFLQGETAPLVEGVEGLTDGVGGPISKDFQATDQFTSGHECFNQPGTPSLTVSGS